MSVSRFSRLAVTRLVRPTVSPARSSPARYQRRNLMWSSSLSSSSFLPSCSSRPSPSSLDEADFVCKGDYIHMAKDSSECQQQTSATFTTLAAPSTAASVPAPLSTVADSSVAATTVASSSAFTSSSASSSSTYLWAASFSTDAESMRRADEEYVLGLFGAKHHDESSVQQKRQQLSADQQTASQFAGTESSQSGAAATATIAATSSSSPELQRKKNKAETKAEARKDRDQGEFDQAGQRVSRVSASQSVKEMEEAGHKQAEHTKRGEQSGADVANAVGDRERAKQQKKEQQAPPRPLDDRRPGEETKDGAAPWSE